jgi:hypothetical protein
VCDPKKREREGGGRVKWGGSWKEKKSEIFERKMLIEGAILEGAQGVFSIIYVPAVTRDHPDVFRGGASYIPPNVPSYLHLVLLPPHYLSLPFFYCSSFSSF